PGRRDHEEHPARVGHGRDEDLARDLEVVARVEDDLRAPAHAPGAAAEAVEDVRSPGGARRRVLELRGGDGPARHDPRRERALRVGFVLALAESDERAEIARQRVAAHGSEDLVDAEVEDVARRLEDLLLSKDRPEPAEDPLDHAERPAPREAHVLAEAD